MKSKVYHAKYCSGGGGNRTIIMRSRGREMEKTRTKPWNLGRNIVDTEIDKEMKRRHCLTAERRKQKRRRRRENKDEM